jgi:hypothetical protein
MAKKGKQNPIVPKSPGVLKGEFTVPEASQNDLKALDGAALQLQQELGRLQLEYLNSRGQVIARFQANRNQYQAQLMAIAKAQGLDLSTPKDGLWSFDNTKMTFTRTDKPAESAAGPQVPPKPPPGRPVG